jgi:hypothetical protein
MSEKLIALGDHRGLGFGEGGEAADVDLLTVVRDTRLPAVPVRRHTAHAADAVAAAGQLAGEPVRRRSKRARVVLDAEPPNHTRAQAASKVRHRSRQAARGMDGVRLMTANRSPITSVSMTGGDA